MSNLTKTVTPRDLIVLFVNSVNENAKYRVSPNIWLSDVASDFQKMSYGGADKALFAKFSEFLYGQPSYYDAPYLVADAQNVAKTLVNKFNQNRWNW